MKIRQRLLIAWVITVILAIACLVTAEYFTLAEENMVQAYKSSDLLMTEIEHILKSREKDRDEYTDYLKGVYLLKAREIAKIIDAVPGMEHDTEAMKQLAVMSGVDEIHLFDETGVLCAGTSPEYFGYSFASGEQISFFSPMLEDRTRTMAQDYTPNTAAGIMMLYAMCWNDAGSHMVQVGAGESILPRIVKRDHLEDTISGIPVGKAKDIFLTGTDSDTIIAATKQELVGKELSEAGITVQDQEYFRSGPPGRRLYCTLRAYPQYRIIIAQYAAEVNQSLPATLVTFTEYLVLIFIVVTFLLDNMYHHLQLERSSALEDPLTGLYNRREFSNTLAGCAGRKVVLISMDLNGLKQINDHQGHAAGDELISGAGECIRQSFEKYGKVFRIGGDEFAAVISAEPEALDRIMSDFSRRQRQWSEHHGVELSISAGYVLAEEHPDLAITDLVKLADEKMYQDKNRYYSDGDRDRRSR